MSLPNGSPRSRHDPVFEVSRDEGGPATIEQRTREAGIKDRNELTAEEAVAVVRALQSRTQGKLLPDSTPQIRADRDGR